MKFVFALIAALAFAAPAAAQHKHGANHKGPNGGPVEDVAGVHAELMVSGATITLNILDEDNKPLQDRGLQRHCIGCERQRARNRRAHAVGRKCAQGRCEGASRKGRCRHRDAQDRCWKIRTGAVQAMRYPRKPL